MLDDAIHEYFEDKTEYTISYGWDNVKLLLMVFATLTAAVSHFFKSPVISERVLIYSCVGAYVRGAPDSRRQDCVVLTYCAFLCLSFFLIHALLLGYSLLVEKDIILRLRKKVRTPVLTIRLLRSKTPANLIYCVLRA